MNDRMQMKLPHKVSDVSYQVSLHPDVVTREFCAAGPVFQQGFDRYGFSQVFCEEERSLASRVQTPASIAGRRHGMDPRGAKGVQGFPLHTGSQHRDLKHEQVLENLTPAYAGMGFQVKGPAPIDKTERSPVSALFDDFALG
jgi:hypothetical protein